MAPDNALFIGQMPIQEFDEWAVNVGSHLTRDAGNLTTEEAPTRSVYD